MTTGVPSATSGKSSSMSSFRIATHPAVPPRSFISPWMKISPPSAVFHGGIRRARSASTISPYSACVIAPRARPDAARTADESSDPGFSHDEVGTKVRVEIEPFGRAAHRLLVLPVDEAVDRCLEQREREFVDVESFLETKPRPVRRERLE